MERVLIFDPFAGISGDMILGGLVDLGLEPQWLHEFVASLGLGDIPISVTSTDRQGIACRKVTFDLPEEHHHRRLEDVLKVVGQSGAADHVKDRAAQVFQRLAAAEAAVHGTTMDEVHFHEVGALDAILDVLCSVAGIAELDVNHCYTRPVAIGSGWVDAAHGRYPLPAPATLKLLEGLVVRETDFAGECTTPTGAAILGTLVADRRPPTQFVPVKSGYGAGTRDPEDRPNCLRLVSGELLTGGMDTVYVIQADLDDMAPEYLPPARQAMLEAGAIDTTIHGPLSMKKGRPGLRVEALAPEHRLDEVLAALLGTTSSIGARYWPVSRQVLARQEEVVKWQGQRIKRKRVRLPNGTYRWKPEYEDVVRAARTLGMAPYQVRMALEGSDLVEGDAQD